MNDLNIPNAEHYTAAYLARREAWAEAYEAIADVLLERFGACRVVDVGCAAGHLVEALRRRGFIAFGVDGAPEAPTFWPPEFRSSYVHMDLTAVGALLPATRGVCCFEVAEHLPGRSAEAFVALLTGHGPSWIAFTAAPPGASPDPSHLNEQPYGYWVEQFDRRGYAMDPVLTCSLRVPLRRHGAIPYWYIRNLFVFRPSLDTPWQSATDWIKLERRFLKMDRLQLQALRHVQLDDVQQHMQEAETLLVRAEPEFYVDSDGRIVFSVPPA